ncbi:MAG: hypothetical protein AB7O93_24105 [Vicinamibacterales bacterium]
MTSRQAWAAMAAGVLLWGGASVGHLRAVQAAVPAVHAAAAGGSAGPAAAPVPGRLSETGLYRDLATLEVDPRNRPFTPQYPLWTDGAAKRRWVRLPEGAVIDVSAIDNWDYPVGTRFWKEFAFDGRRVETRMLVKTSAAGWAFASYVWNEDQRDAVLAPEAGVADVAEVAPGKYHSVPSIADCRSCHDSRRTEVMGFTALQLSDDRDPLAPHAEAVAPGMVTLKTLAAEGRLSPPRPDLVATPPRVAASDPRERAVLGYLSTNCGSCHNRASTIASLGLVLKYSLAAPGGCAADAIATTAGRPGHWVVPTAPEGASRLLSPGRPDLSALVYRARSRRPASQMPPLGSVVADREALALMDAWIASGVPASAACLAPVSTH